MTHLIYKIVTFYFRNGFPNQHPIRVPPRYAVSRSRPSDMVLSRPPPQQQSRPNNYVAEFTRRAPPPRPYKPDHLRVKSYPDPKKVIAYEPASISKPTNDKAVWQKTIGQDSRDEKLLPNWTTPPTLDEFIRRQQSEKRSSISQPIRTQPLGSLQHHGSRPGQHGFICPSCRKCTCNSCVQQSTNESCDTASCDECIDTVSCFCLVRGCSYHLSYDETASFNRLMSDKPASCQISDPTCVTRWSILTGITLMLPCLLIYPAYKSSKYLTSKMSSKFRSHVGKGCKCRQNMIGHWLVKRPK